MTTTTDSLVASLEASLPTTLTLQKLSLALAQGVMAAYDAYNNGSNNTPVLPGYKMLTPIYVWESDPNISPFAKLAEADAAARTKKQAAAYCSPPPTTGEPSFGKQLFGFSAVANDQSHNIVVLRGTVTLEEAGYDMLGWDHNTPCLLPSSGAGTQHPYGNVNSALYDFYTRNDAGLVTSLAASFQAAVRAIAQANPNAPWYVAAHSLGGPLATLGALDAYLSGSYTGSSKQPVVITFGGLHLGDQAFATAYQAELPLGLRFANLCDFVPSMVSLAPNTPTDPYVHVGIPATFVWQTWDDWGNHSMECIYLQMVQSLTYWDLLKFGPRTYPQ
jgi:hypothetical protein